MVCRKDLSPVAKAANAHGAINKRNPAVRMVEREMEITD